MRIQAIGRFGIGAAARRSSAGTPAQSRALTVVAPAAPREQASFSTLPRPDAGVVVQLFAARDGLPQARDKRRADPAVASSAYATGTGVKPDVAKRIVDFTA